MPVKPDNVEEQRALLEAVLAERPDAILLVPTHGTALNDILRRIEAAGILLLCAVSRPEVIVPKAFVGSDDRALARGIADYLFDRMPSGGTIVTIEGHPNAMTTAPARRAFATRRRAGPTSALPPRATATSSSPRARRPWPRS